MNQKIIVAVVVIAGTGITNAWLDKKPITTIIIGSYVLLLVLSIMDMFGGRISQLASAIAMLAVVYVLLTEFPWQQLVALTQGRKA